jgi:DhnA family fructose-bisphosphate aldolase class Ia
MFSPQQFLPDAAMVRLTEIRVADPEYSLRQAQARTRRERLAPTGKLNIVAADHPARRVTKVGDNPIAMADRRDYLSRILRVLSAEAIDGLMATMDILEDLFILDGLLRQAGAPSLLDGKVLIGSLNRGGLAGSSWELDDPITGPAPATCAAWRLDGAKILLRIADAEAGSLKTMLASAQAITECNALRLPMFLEPLPVSRTDSGWSVKKDCESLARIAGVASALGDSSRYLWLKLPYCSGYETVARSTSLPILLLGGESAGDPSPFLHELASALHAGPNVRGALVGRNVLYPGDEDPFAMACAVGGIIHQNWSVDHALQSLRAEGQTLPQSEAARPTP